MKSLIGKRVTLTPTGLTSVKVFARKGHCIPLEHSLSQSFKTLETDGESAWHCINPTTVEIGLNDYVFDQRSIEAARRA